jgi:2,5-diketo-D-gluconate reductase B
VKRLKLNKESYIPILGLGTWQLRGRECQKAVEYALKIGYRHFDTADVYGNHKELGDAIKKSGIKRKDFFITTKVWRSNLRKKGVSDSTNRFLDELGTDYIDLLLIHWPNSQIPIEETLEAMNGLKEKGKIKAMGVSNFTTRHLVDALATKFEVAVNQVEFHPSLNQKGLKNYCDQKGIVITAYSPIAQGQDLILPEIKKLTKKYNKSESQVILNWLMQKNMVAIPRSCSTKHIKDNFDTLNWNLKERDIELIDQIGGEMRLINPGFSEFN